jgi:hypothetical protein
MKGDNIEKISGAPPDGASAARRDKTSPEFV